MAEIAIVLLPRATKLARDVESHVGNAELVHKIANASQVPAIFRFDAPG